MTDRGREWPDKPPNACQPTMTCQTGKSTSPTSSESAKCIFSSNSKHHELTGAEANNIKDTPCGTTWADHQRARGKGEGERKEAEEGSRNAQHSHKHKRNMQTYSSIRYW